MRICPVLLFLLCLAFVPHCRRSEETPQHSCSSNEECRAGNCGCIHSGRIKRNSKHEMISCRNSSLTCTEVYHCPIVMRGLQSFYGEVVREAQLKYCGRDKYTSHVCCHEEDIRRRSLLETSKDSRHLVMGACGRGGITMIDGDRYRTLLEIDKMTNCDSNSRRRKRNTDCESPRRKRFSGGPNAEIGQFPWVAAIYRLGNNKSAQITSIRPSYLCMGTVITNLFLLTSKFCLTKKWQWFYPEFLLQIYVTVGEYDVATLEPGNGYQVDELGDVRYLETKPQLFEVDQMYHNHHSHEIVKNRLMEGDISIIRLRDRIIFNPYVEPICLPTKSEKPRDIDYFRRTAVTVVGYGFHTEHPDIGLLKRGEFELSDLYFCGEFHAHYFNIVRHRIVFEDVSICAQSSYFRHDDPMLCGSDTGGPLMQQAEDGRMFLIGVKNYPGVDDCSLPLPSPLYTKVEPFMDWITDILNRFTPVH